ncbi:MAG: hypothetical protein ACK5YS_04195, partial [bacterium]
DPLDPFVLLPGLAQPNYSKCRYRINLESEGNSLNALFSIGQSVSCVLPYSYSYFDQLIGYTSSIDTYVSNFNVLSINGNSMDVEFFIHANSFTSGGTVMYQYNKPYSLPGGGYRVKSIEVSDNFQSQANVTSYEYDANGVTTGFTSYEPDVFDHVSLIRLSAPLEQVARKAIKSFSSLKFARELPSPGAMYQLVRVKESSISNGLTETFLGYSEYQFQPLLKQMINEESSLSGGYPSPGNYLRPYDGLVKKEVRISDYTSHVGKLKSITLYGSNGAKISETKYKYLFDEAVTPEYFDPSTSTTYLSSFDYSQYSNKLTRYSYQGQVDEVTWDARFVKPYLSSGFGLLGVISKRSTFPPIQTETVSTNFKTNVTTTEKNLSFDFFSGNVTRKLSSDGYGNNFSTEITPAYRKYDKMNPAALGGKNMLTQQAASTTYKIDPTTTNKLGLVSASVQTWSDQAQVMGVAGNNSSAKQMGIWRMKSSFSFVGEQNNSNALTVDGLHKTTLFNDFTNWTTHEEQAGWQKNSEITLYDYNSHAIEAKDINEKFAATKFSVDHSQVLATAANASYNELAFSGAEETTITDGTNQVFGGGVINSGKGFSTTSYHTGSRSIISDDYTRRGFTYKFTAPNPRIYFVSVWANRNDAKIKYRMNNGAVVEAVLLPIKQAGGWHLINSQIPVSSAGTLVEMWCEANGTTTQSGNITVIPEGALFDDFRVHPVDAAMTSYVYNNWGELTHILDNNNLYTEYKYDG